MKARRVTPARPVPRGTRVPRTFPWLVEHAICTLALIVLARHDKAFRTEAKSLIAKHKRITEIENAPCPNIEPKIVNPPRDVPPTVEPIDNPWEKLTYAELRQLDDKTRARFLADPNRWVHGGSAEYNKRRAPSGRPRAIWMDTGPGESTIAYPLTGDPLNHWSVRWGIELCSFNNRAAG